MRITIETYSPAVQMLADPAWCGFDQGMLHREVTLARRYVR